MNKRVLLAVDVANLYMSCRDIFGGKVDYSQLLDFGRRFGLIHRAIAYGAEMSDEANGFKSILHDLGFECKFKRVKVFGSGQKKANWDVGMAVDVIKILPHVDVVVLASADSDFEPLLDYIQHAGKECVVVGANISQDLNMYSCFEIQESMIIKDQYENSRATIASSL